MPPRKTTDFGALFESLIEDLRIQVSASFDQSLSEIEKRIARIEKRLDQLDPAQPGASSADETHPRRACSVCGKPSVARGLCSAHYQQWRYRVRKAKAKEAEEREQHEAESKEKEATFVFSPLHVSHDN